MRWLPLLIAPALLLAIAGCDSPRRDAAARLQRAGASQLRTDAARLYKNVFAGHAPDFLTLKASQWPASFQKVAPISVGAYPDGFALALRLEGESESGIWIVPLHMDAKPQPNRSAVFLPLAEGIYWYDFAR